MMTAIMFSRQNDAGSRVSTTSEKIIFSFVVVLVLESKGVYYLEIVGNVCLCI